MHIIISGHGIEMTPSLRDYAQAKVSKLEEFFHNIQKVEVVLDARNIGNSDRHHVCEIRAWLAGNKVIQAKEGSKDMYAAIDLATDEAKRQVEKHKEKTVDEHRRQGAKLKKLSRETLSGSPEA